MGYVKGNLVTVIRDSRDARKGYYLPRDVARSLYEIGKLYWDATNGTYCTPGPMDSRIGTRSNSDAKRGEAARMDGSRASVHRNEVGH